MSPTGTRGPVPNHSSDLNRSRERKGGEAALPITKGTRRPVTIPEVDPNWHPIAKMLYESLQESGQADFYQSSDWAFAYSVCEDLSLYKQPLVAKDGTEYYKRSGQMLQSIYSAFERLLVSEGDRRRVRVELEEPEAAGDDAAVTAINDYKRTLGLVRDEGDDEEGESPTD